MNAELKARMQKIQKVSGGVSEICKVLMAFALAAFLVLVVVIFSGIDRGTIGIGGIEIHANQLSVGGKLVIALYLGFFGFVLFKGLSHLSQLFDNYSRGEIFTKDSVAQLMRLGFVALLAAGVKIFAFPVAVMLIHNHNPGNASVELMIPFTELIIGGLVILISWIMDTGRLLREENELTI
ncbi:MAG: DUF2975 domain-containing protein [Chloroflexota bacterium]